MASDESKIRRPPSGWKSASEKAEERARSATSKPTWSSTASDSRWPGGRRWSAQSRLAAQEVERRAVEGLGILVQTGVEQVVEDDQLAARDPAREWLGEARGAHEVARAEGDERRRLDVFQHGAGVVRERSLALGQERLQRLGG